MQKVTYDGYIYKVGNIDQRIIIVNERETILCTGNSIYKIVRVSANRAEIYNNKKLETFEGEFDGIFFKEGIYTCSSGITYEGRFDLFNMRYPPATFRFPSGNVHKILERRGDMLYGQIDGSDVIIKGLFDYLGHTFPTLFFGTVTNTKSNQLVVSGCFDIDKKHIFTLRLGTRFDNGKVSRTGYFNEKTFSEYSDIKRGLEVFIDHKLSYELSVKLTTNIYNIDIKEKSINKKTVSIAKRRIDSVKEALYIKIQQKLYISSVTELTLSYCSIFALLGTLNDSMGGQIRLALLR